MTMYWFIWLFILTKSTFGAIIKKENSTDIYINQK